MIKLQAHYNLKVPTDIEYSTQQAGACIEIEVAEGDAGAIPAKLASVWAMLRRAVEEELRNGVNNAPANGHGNQSPGGNNDFGAGSNAASQDFGGNGNGNQFGSGGNGSSQGYGNNGNGAYTGGDPGGTATRKQIGLLLALGRRNRNMNAEQTKQAVRELFNCDLNQLTKAQASEIIDQLKNKVSS